jgi:hypothetical protein
MVIWGGLYWVCVHVYGDMGRVVLGLCARVLTSRVFASCHSPDGGRAIAYALKINAVLKTLEIQNNDLGDKGATEMAMMIKVR